MDSLPDHVNWISKYWHVITGASLAIWWSAVRVKRSLFTNYPTFEDMEVCKDQVVELIKTHEEREEKIFAEIKDESRRTHAHLDKKLDRIIDHLLGDA